MKAVNIRLFVDVLEKWCEKVHHVFCLCVFVVKDKLLALVAQVNHQFRVACLTREVNETQDVDTGVSEALVLHQKLSEGTPVIVGRVFDKREQHLANVVEICDPLYVEQLVSNETELPAKFLVQIESQRLGRC